MGYSYAKGGGVCCDSCGGTPARKRTCPHKVIGSTFRMRPAVRSALPYCQAPALCSTCYQREKATLHADCKEGAERAQRAADKEQCRIDAGEFLRAAAWGDWHEQVPAGKVGVLFVNQDKEERFYLVPSAEYRGGGAPTIPADYSEVIPIPALR